MTQDPQTPSTSGRRWLRVALLVSLVVNLLFVGLVLGAAAGKDRNDRRVSQSEDRVLSHLGPYGKALPEERRKALAQTLRPKAGDATKLKRELRKGFQEYLTLLKAETLDIEAVEQLIDAQQALVVGRATASKDALLEVLVNMSAEERAAYADELQKVLRRGPGGNRGKGEDGPPRGDLPPPR